MMLPRWVAALRELAPDVDASGQSAASEDDEWQQLASALLLEGQAASQLAHVGSIRFVDETSPDSPRLNFRRV